MSTTELPPGVASTDIDVARWRMPSWDGLAYILFGAVAIIVLLTFQDYGVTWDEDGHNWYGVFVLNYYRLRLHRPPLLPLDGFL